MRIPNSIWAAAFTALALGASVRPAAAASILALGGPVSFVACNPNLPSNVTNCGAGFAIVGGGESVTFSGTVDGFDVVGLIGGSNSPGTPTAATLALNMTVTNVSSSHRIFFADLSGFSFSFPSGPAMSATGTASVPASGDGASFSVAFYADDTNTGALLNGANCDFVAPGGCSATASWTRSAPFFSLRMIETITLEAGQSITVGSGMAVAPVPEPGSALLMGAGVLAFLARRKTSPRPEARA